MGSINSVPRARLPLRVLVIAAVAALVILVQGKVFRWQPVDDAYISFRYSAHLAAGDGLVFNVGERTEGYSNFLWTLILAGAAKAGADLPRMAVWLGVGLSLLAGVLTYQLARAVAAERRWPEGLAWVAPILLACYPGWSYWAFSGMEGPLVTCLALGFVLAGCRGTGWRGAIGAGGLGALMAMTRWETVILWPVVILARTRLQDAHGRRCLAQALTLLAVSLLGFGIYFAWRYAYYGDLLPNTYYVKLAAPLAARLGRGGAYTAEFAVSWLLPISGIVWICGGVQGLSGVLLGILGIYVGYATWTGGDFFAWLRFYLPVMPVAAIFLTDTVAQLCRQLDATGRRRFVAWGLAVSAALTVGGIGLRLDMPKAGSHRDLVTNWSRVGLWTSQSLAPDCRIALTPVGVIPFRSGLPTIDLLGLTDYETAHAGATDLTEGPGHQRHNIPSILRRRPEVILGEAYLYSAPPARDACATGAARHVLKALYQNAEFLSLYEYQVAQVGQQYLPYWVRRDRLDNHTVCASPSATVSH